MRHRWSFRCAWPGPDGRRPTGPYPVRRAPSAPSRSRTRRGRPAGSCHAVPLARRASRVVREARADQLEFHPHAFGVAVTELGGKTFRRLEDPAQGLGQFRYPVDVHTSMIRATGLLFNSQLAHTGLQMTVEMPTRALEVDLLARELGNWRTSSRSGPAYQG